MPDPFSVANSASADLIFLDLADADAVAGLVGQIRSLTCLFSGPAATLADHAADALAGPGDEDQRRRRTAELLEQCLAAAETAATTPLEAPIMLPDQARLDFLERAGAALDELDPQGGIAAFKRKLHSLKGDAGVVGLRDEAACCHAMEDALARGLQPAQLTEALRWLEDSFTAHRFGIEPPPVGQIIERLHQRSPLGQTLVAQGLVTAETLAAALAQQTNLTPGRPLGEILLDAGRISPQALAAVLGAPIQPPVRVDADRLAALDAAIRRVATSIRHLTLAPAVRRQLDRHLHQLRDCRIDLHRTTARGLLERMARVAQETARSLDRDLRLELVGAGVALDRTLADQLADPLQHLVRNAIGHGLEPAAERQEHGKDPTGTLAIRMLPQARGLRIEIADDGRGIDVPRVLEKAGLPADTVVDGERLWTLISQPGFSTAGAVTALSGRGIGLDVVGDLVSQWGGSMSLRTVSGLGSTFIIILPPHHHR